MERKQIESQKNYRIKEWFKEELIEENIDVEIWRI